jgi:hypothetical protein
MVCRLFLFRKKENVPTWGDEFNSSTVMPTSILSTSSIPHFLELFRAQVSEAVSSGGSGFRGITARARRRLWNSRVLWIRHYVMD